MFLLVSVRHVDAHSDGHQRCVSIQISFNFGKNISSDISYTKYSSDLNLGEGLCTFTSFHFPDFGLYLLAVSMFILINFEWRDTENQQSFSTAAVISDGTPFSLLKSYDVTSQMNSIYHGTFTWFFLLRSPSVERNLNSTRENPGY